MVGWLEFNVPFQHKYGYIRDERVSLTSGIIAQYKKSDSFRSVKPNINL